MLTECPGLLARRDGIRAQRHRSTTERRHVSPQPCADARERLAAERVDDRPLGRLVLPPLLVQHHDDGSGAHHGNEPDLSSAGDVAVDVARRVSPFDEDRLVATRRADDRFTTWYGSEVTRRLRRLALGATAGLVVAGLFYAANSFAAAYGAGRGYDDAIRLPRQPEIVIDTRERLIDLPPGVVESALPAGKETTFHYRYAGLRLLLESGERLFLVPGNWTAQSRTLVVPYDSDIRIQLIPRQQ
jgi:hypothetical protein